MKRQVPKHIKDAERMVAATQRLEALLRDPGPGITVTPTSYDEELDVEILSSNVPPAALTAAAAAPTAPASDAAADAVEQPTAVQRLQAALRQRAAASAAAEQAAGHADIAARSPEAAARPGDAQPEPAPGLASPSPVPAGETDVALSKRPLLSAIDALSKMSAPAPAAATDTAPAIDPTPAQRARPSDPLPAADGDTEEHRLTAPDAPRVADNRDGDGASNAQRPSGRSTRRPADGAKATAPTPTAASPASTVAAPAPAPALPSRPAPARARIEGLRNNGFTGFIIDWLLPGNGDLKIAVAQSARAFGATGLFSFAINILMLAGPLFMLQVYDRVMTSGSIPTLVALFAITAGLYAVIGILELVRSRIVVRIGVEVDQRLSERIFRASLRRTLATPGQALPALRELDSLRQFVSSQGPLTFFDAPWTPVYLVVIFLVHWVLGVTALVGGVLLVALAWMSESRSRGPIIEAGKASSRSLELAETGQRNAEAITAMGMLGAYIARWQRANGEAIAWQTLATDRLGGMAAVSKAARLLLQSLMLAVGAWLAVKGDISAGSIIAGTIIFGRALAPVEQGITHWRGFLKARESYFKLDDLLNREPVPPQKTALPTPKGHLEVTALRVAAPDTRQLILSNLNFRLEPGQMLAVIGPSASGKSTLARTIVGLWPAFSGLIELDGARLDQWDGEALGRHIGYLPQNVELFSGTVKDNISRFRQDATDDEIMAAARMAHAHEMILALPQGYDTELGNFGTYLSAGQRQRIGLARALFGNPALIVLDEPNANLDRSGDEALSSAIDGCRTRGQAIMLVSHRVQAIGKADLLLYLDRGMQRAFGPRAEVMKLFQGPAPQAQQQQNAAPQNAAPRAPSARNPAQ